MCHCPPGVRFGTYENAVAVPCPAWLYESRKHLITVDRCLLQEVVRLWNHGVKTRGSCCGHNGLGAPYIAVATDSVPTMHQLGYEEVFNELSPLGRYVFHAQSID